MLNIAPVVTGVGADLSDITIGGQRGMAQVVLLQFHLLILVFVQQKLEDLMLKLQN